MLFSGASRFEIEFWVRTERKVMAADAPRIRRAAAAKVTRVRRAVRASGEQRCSRAVVPVCRAWTLAPAQASIREVTSGERERALLSVVRGEARLTFGRSGSPPRYGLQMAFFL